MSTPTTTGTVINHNKTISITKGCASLGIKKGRGTLVSTQELGADYGYSVRVVISTHGKTYAFYARHINRLSDPEVNLNNGNPTKTIKVKF